MAEEKDSTLTPEVRSTNNMLLLNFDDLEQQAEFEHPRPRSPTFGNEIQAETHAEFIERSDKQLAKMEEI